MQSIIKKLTLICVLLISLNIEAKETYSLGIGLGTSYSGLGVNISQLSNEDMKYVSAGCTSYVDNESTCGLGLGWIKTDLFETTSKKHGLGAYVGIVGSKRNKLNYKREAVHGIGVGYHYFVNGINHPGSNLGVSLVVGDSYKGIESSIVLQLGYQF